MFERIAYDCHAPQCLYQLSLFHLMNKLYKDPMSRCMMNIMDNNKYASSQIYASTYTSEDMFVFFRQLIGKFFEQAQANNILYTEILFFKDKKILMALGEENTNYKEAYETVQSTNGNKRKIAWTEEENEELKTLFDKFKKRFNDDDDEEEDITDFKENEQDAGDIIDLILLNIRDGTRKRRDICVQLANLNCVESLDVFKTDKYTFKNKKPQSRNKLWRKEDLYDLRQCFELISTEAKQENKPLSEMMIKLQTCLKIKRQKKHIIDKLVDLKLVEDKNDLLKKSKKQKSKLNREDFIDDSGDSNDANELKMKKKKKKKEKNNEENGNKNNDLFDAESGSSSDSDESDSESSESESESSSQSEAESEPKKKNPNENESNEPNEKVRDIIKPIARKISNKKFLKMINGYSSEEEENNDDLPKKASTIETNLFKKNKLLDLDEEDDENSNSSSKSSSLSGSDVSITKKPAKKRTIQLLDDDDEASNFSSKKSSDDSERDDEKSKEPKTTTATKKMASESDSDSDSDNDLHLSSLASSNKRQKLILEEDDY